MDVYIIDACSLLAFFKNETGVSRVTELFEQAQNDECVIYLHFVNMYEVYYDFVKSDDIESANKILTLIDDLPIVKSNLMTKELFQKAAFYKSRFRISFADSILLGTAEHYNGVVISADHHEFDIIEQNGLLKFYWFR